MTIQHLVAKYGPAGFSLSHLQKRYDLAGHLLALKDLGWSHQALESGLASGHDWTDSRLGSPFFMALWRFQVRPSSSKQAQAAIKLLLGHLGMAANLTGQQSETAALLAKFWPDLAPDHEFWPGLANLVNQAFPDDSLSQAGQIGRQVHQLRYVISSQQAQWVRQYYGQGKGSDAQALARFLKGQRRRKGFSYEEAFSVNESARLHNKSAQHQLFSDGQETVNIKILLAFHSEFILDSRGRFLNALDMDRSSQEGIVNSASFNYAASNNRRHWDLDIAPVKRHDPAFRRQAMSQQGGYYLAPSVSKSRKEALDDHDWQRSYFNPNGDYARSGKSNYQAVQEANRAFRRLIKKS